MKAFISFFIFLYLAVHMIQMLAIADGLSGALHVPPFLSFVCAYLVTWFPIIGLALGTFGAREAWGWPWLGAALFFVSPFLMLVLRLALAIFVEGTKERFRATATPEPGPLA